MFEWLTCLLRVLLLMWMSLFDMFCKFHFLKVTKEVESLIVTSLIAFLPRMASCLGRCGRRVLKSGIRAWFTPQTRWAMCWPCMHVNCMFFSYTYILITFSCCSMVIMENFLLISWNVFEISMWLTMYGLYVTYMLILWCLLISLYVRLHFWIFWLHASVL